MFAHLRHGKRARHGGGARLAAFRADRCGATMIEFALVAMPFLAIVGAIFEVGYVDFENEVLANAVSKAARAMLTGKTQAAKIADTAGFVSTYLCPATGVRPLPQNFDCSKLIVDVRPALTFSGADLTNALYKSAANKFCPGAPGQVVVLRVAYPLGAILPLNLFSRSAGVVSDVPNLPGNYHILLGSALFQEEAYTTGYTPPAGC